MNENRLSQFMLIVALISSIFLLGTDNLVISPLLTEIGKDEQASIHTVALGVTLYSGTYGLFSMLLAPISDILSRKRVVVLAALLFGLSSFCIAIFHNISTFLIFRAVTGLFAAMLGPNLWAYNLDLFESGKRETVTSWMMSAFSLATVIGVPIGMVLASFFGWSSIFYLIGVISVLMSLVFAIYGKGTPSKNKLTFRTHFGNIGLAWKKNWHLAFSMLFASGSYLCVYPFIGDWLGGQPNGWTLHEVTVAFLVIGITTFLGNMVGGRLMKKFGPRQVTKQYWIGRPIIIAIVLICMFFVHSAILFTVTVAIWTLISGVGNTAFMAYVGSRGGQIRGSVMSLNNGSIFLGFMLGSYLGGVVWGAAHSMTANLITGLVCSVLGVLFISLDKKENLPAQQMQQAGGVSE